MKPDREKRPRRGGGWMEMPLPRAARTETTLEASAWYKGAVRVISELCLAELPGGNGAAGPTWHISVTRFGRRPMPRDVEHALRDFDLVGAEQDNHHPGAAQHFFLPVDPAHRGQCECKTTEDIIVEPDGYTWTNPKLDAVEACRGCEHERLHGKPCPLHQRTQVPEYAGTQAPACIDTLRRFVEEEL